MKDLFSALPQRLFRHLCGLEINEIAPIEISGRLARRPDLFGRLSDGQYFHGELQADGDPEMAWRMLGYRWFFWSSLHVEDVVQVVFALRGKASIPGGLTHLGLQFRYQVVDFQDIDAAVLAVSNQPEELVLSVLCRGGTAPENVRRVLLRCLECQGDRRDFLIGHLQVLSGLRPGLDQTIQKEFAKMPVTIDLLENVMFREAYERAVAKGHMVGIEQGLEKGIEQGIEKGLERGLEKGLEEGLEKGLAEGVEQGQRKLLAQLLERRFGPLSGVHRERLQQGAAADLSRWADRILDAPNAAAVFE